MRHAAAALVVALASAAALAQDKPAKEMESQSEIADRIVAEQQGLKIREVDGAMSAPARAFAPLEGGDVQAPAPGPAEIAAAEDAAIAAAKKAKQSGGIPWGVVAGALVSLGAVVIFVRAWRRAGDAN